MVGLFHLGSKGSPARSTRSTDTVRPHTPPPPYGQDSHEQQVFSTETTMTTTHTVTTTTQTTTHFFSLPLWLRRTHQPNGASSEAKPMNSDELGVLGPSTSSIVMMRDKALPPTPPAGEIVEDITEDISAAGDFLSVWRASTENGRLSSNVVASSSQQSCVPHLLPPSNSNQGTAALARAALGLGLPPVMLNSAPGSSSEVNSVSFVMSPSSSDLSPECPSSSSAVRRTKSFHKYPEGDSPTPYVEVKVHRRARGLSIGPLLSTSTSDEKGKGKLKDAESRSLSRKSSFWNRKRNDSRAVTPVNPPSPSQFLHPSTLPALQPLSPFRVDTIGSSSSSQDISHATQTAELRRRHSERTASHTSRSSKLDGSSVPSSPAQGQRRRRSSRPQTADSPASPRAVSAYFPGPTSLTNSPPALAESPSEKSDISFTQNSSLRPRAQTNPPLLHRLSMNLFGSSPSAPSPVATNVLGEMYNRSPSTSFSSSRPSISRQSPKVSVEIPRPRYHEEESPEIYVQRLMEAVSKAEVATVLASSADDFHARALRVYMSRFDFSHDSLDVALRRLLMDVGLPRETQQIDRVMEAFALRYRRCHPNLFISEDHPYILAFSLIMLHTDAFNKSNKRKMTKADYMKNTRLPGVAPEVLDCFYDNIVFAPFIFIEDPLDVNGQRGLIPEGPTTRRLSTLNGSPGGLNSSATTLLGKNNKIDPYYLITRNLLDNLRVNIRPHIPLTSPYFYQGTGGSWDEDKLLRAFAMANVVEVASEHRYLASPWFGMNVGGGPSSLAMMPSPAFVAMPVGVTSLKVTKVGLLLRKDDIMEGGRKANSRKWKEWSVLLTGSQLLFSRDPSWGNSIQSRAHAANGVVTLHHASMPRPDEMYSVKDTVAVYDRSYTKHEYTLRLVMPDGRHLLLQAKDEGGMNEWLSCINYASAFKTAGVRMRSLGLSGRDIELTGQAAAVSHLRDIKRPPPSPRIRTWGDRAFADVDSLPCEWQPSTDSNLNSELISEEPVTPPTENPSRLFKATFDQVKADLAAGKWQSFDAVSIASNRRPRAYSLDSTLQSPSSPTLDSMDDSNIPRVSSRPQIIRRKIRDLNSKILLQKSQLDSDMRFVRNIAILAPFQRSTRDRLQVAIQNVARRIMQVRLEVEKLTCHRDVLVQDLAAEERDWQRTKKIALRAATQKLDMEWKRSAPRMTLSLYVDDDGDRSPSPSKSTMRRTPMIDTTHPHSAAASSYHSALEYVSDSASPDPGNQRLVTSLSSDFSTHISLTDSSISTSSPYGDSPRPPTLSVRSSADSASALADTEEHSGISHEQFYTASETPEELAEDWNKTRAAKRVSLVRVPSTLQMSVFSPKHARDFDQILSKDSGNTIMPNKLYRTSSTPGAAPSTPMNFGDDAAAIILES